MSNNLNQTILQELSQLLDPLTQLGRDPLLLIELFDQIGWDLEAISGLDMQQMGDVIDAFSAAYATVEAFSLNPPANLADVNAALASVQTAVTALSAIPELLAADSRPSDFEAVALDLLDHLTSTYLQQRSPALWQTLILLTLVDGTDSYSEPIAEVVTPDGRLLRRRHRRPRLRLDRLATLLRDPVDLLRVEYLPASGLTTTSEAQAVADKLFRRLSDWLYTLGADTYYGMQPGLGYDLGTAGDEMAARMLSFLKQFQIAEGVTAQVGATLALSPRDEADLGLVVIPMGTLTLAQELTGWKLEISGTLGIDALGITREEVILFGDPGTARFDLAIKLSRLREPGASPIRIGGNSGTRLEIAQLTLSSGLSLGATQRGFDLMLDVGKAALVVAATEGDGFLQAILPPAGLSIPFDLGLGWSSSQGLHFRGSSSLDAILPVQLDLLGALKIDSAHLSLRAIGDGDQATLDGVIATTAVVKLGPVTTVVERMGLRARLSFPAEGGNLGLAHLVLDFKPPSGAALSIKAAAVGGGGYLFFDPEHQQYAGIVELELGGTIAVKAIGLITTRMPDGSPGFSLFLLITAEGFAPIQLGMGFTLNGIGGLLGLNRTVMTDVLRDGLKSNALDSVLFPVDPLGNAPAIVRNLNTVFPPAPNRFLFGPMAILGWGTPTIVTLKIALILEIPDPVRLVMLGRLSVVLPDPEHPLVRIQLDTVGELNFQKGTLSLDGVLYDSKLLDFVLTGAMALRASWGETPHFILAMGGFNPRFVIPSGFPRLERLALSLASGDDLRLRLEAYLAITSNTAQFGARLEVFAKAGSLSIDGYLGFDTLFQFAPFGFIADIAAGVALRYNNSLLASVQLDITISGPTPWHFRGTAKIQSFLLSYSVDIDYCFGPAEPPPLPAPIDVGALLRAALDDPRSWSAELAGAQHPLVVLRGVEGDDLVAHPLSRLTVRQRIVPLDFQISRFGNTTPSGEREFHVQVASGQSSFNVQANPIEEYFALAQFQDLREDEKLVRPSFEKMKAGYEFSSDTYAYTLSLGLDSPIEYETITMDSTEQAAGARGLAQPYRMTAGALDNLIDSGAAGQCAFRNEARF